MFTQKKTQLFNKKVTATATTKKPSGAFVKAAMQENSVVPSGNGAKKYSTTGNALVDQFGVLGSYKAQRGYADIAASAELAWAEDPLNAVKFILYLRTIPRKVQLMNGETTSVPQLGGELKHESIMRMFWLNQKSPETFWANLPLFISLGSWKDVITMLQFDLVYHGWDNRVLNWNKMGDLILSGLSNKNTCELLKKYLPQIKARSKCNSVESQADVIIAKWICSLLFGEKESSYNYKQYRSLKTSGAAHDWQKLISQKKFDKIDFSKIHGRALSLLVKSKFLKNQGLSEKYSAWIKKPETKNVKYTGFVHELFNQNLRDGNIAETVNKQFETLVEKAKIGADTLNLMPVIDSSGSMGSVATGTSCSCLHIAKSIALYCSEFLSGKFAGSFMEFNDEVKMHYWVGETPVEKFLNNKCSYIGSTNFQSVIDLFVAIKNQGVAEEEFPTGILCLSDQEYNPSNLNETNVQTARKKLRAAFSKDFADNFMIVLWNLQSNAYGPTTGKKFEGSSGEKGTAYFSGFSASVIQFLESGKIDTPEDLFNRAMDQELLNLVRLV